MLKVAVPEDRGDVLRFDFQILIIHSEKEKKRKKRKKIYI